MSLRQGSERSGLFLDMWEDHLTPGAASGEQQQPRQPATPRLLHEAPFYGVMQLQPFGSWHFRRAQRLAVLPAERASSALRCARRCAGEAVGPRMYHLYHLHVHVRDSRKVWSVILWTQVVHACVTCISMRE